MEETRERIVTAVQIRSVLVARLAHGLDLLPGLLGDEGCHKAVVLLAPIDQGSGIDAIAREGDIAADRT